MARVGASPEGPAELVADLYLAFARAVGELTARARHIAREELGLSAAAYER